MTTSEMNRPQATVDALSISGAREVADVITMTGQHLCLKVEKSGVMDWWHYAQTVTLSSFFAFAGCSLTYIGFDFAYNMVETLAAQPYQESLNQAIIALVAQPCLVFPIFLGFSLAYFRARSTGARRWNLALATIVTMVVTAWMIDLLNANAMQMLMNVGWLVAALGVAFGSHAIGLKLARNEKAFTGSAASLSYLFPAGLLGALACVDGMAGYAYDLEAYAYAAFVMLASVTACLLAKPATKKQALGVALVAVAPILAINVVNVAGNLFSMLLDVTFNAGADLGWRSLASAAIILGVSLVAAVVAALSVRCKQAK